MLEEVNKKTIISFSNEEKEELFGKDIKYYPYINYSSSLKKEIYGSITIDGVLPGSKEYLYESSLYVVKVIGTAIVDKEYLSNTFNDGKEIEVLAGDINDTLHPYGVILTDYLADSFNYINMLNLSYEEMIGQVISSNLGQYYVNAIIKTNYKEHNKELFDKFEQIKKQANFIDEYKKLLNEDIFINFFSSIINLENLSFYTINNNFFNDIIND